jgi:hypothetical protein
MLELGITNSQTDSLRSGEDKQTHIATNITTKVNISNRYGHREVSNAKKPEQWITNSRNAEIGKPYNEATRSTDDEGETEEDESGSESTFSTKKSNIEGNSLMATLGSKQTKSVFHDEEEPEVCILCRNRGTELVYCAGCSTYRHSSCLTSSIFLYRGNHWRCETCTEMKRKYRRSRNEGAEAFMIDTDAIDEAQFVVMVSNNGFRI